LIFAQEYLEHEPYDYKAYAIGDQVHAIKRIFPATTREEKDGVPVGDDPELVDLVRRCGPLFGLDLYGVDLVKTPKGYSVIEVNCFPGYKGVPQAGERISQFILDRGNKPTS
jgi:ribosomal protein S6--L-glutamate ligase